MFAESDYYERKIKNFSILIPIWRTNVGLAVTDSGDDRKRGNSLKTEPFIGWRKSPFVFSLAMTDTVFICLRPNRVCS